MLSNIYTLYSKVSNHAEMVTFLGLMIIDIIYLDSQIKMTDDCKVFYIHIAGY